MILYVKRDLKTLGALFNSMHKNKRHMQELQNELEQVF